MKTSCVVGGGSVFTRLQQSALWFSFICLGLLSPVVALATSTILISGGDSVTNSTLATSITLSGAGLNNNGAGILTLGEGNLTLYGSSSLIGGTTVSISEPTSGFTTLTVSNAAGILTLSSSSNLTGGTTVLTSGSLIGAGTLVKSTGSGILTLSGLSTFNESSSSNSNSTVLNSGTLFAVGTLIITNGSGVITLSGSSTLNAGPISVTPGTLVNSANNSLVITGATLQTVVLNGGTLAVQLPVKVSAKTISVNIPSGCTACQVEVRLKGAQKWVRWNTSVLNGKPSLLTLNAPRVAGPVEWRATGTISSEKAKAFAKKSKFSDAFYQGPRVFDKAPALGYVATTASGYANGQNSGVPVPTTVGVTSGVVDSLKVANVTSTVTATATPTITATNTTATTTSSTTSTQVDEPDIWKTEGNSVYFFNQLRGLQVLDVSDPSTPKLSAYLRQPCVGQDLYLLPEAVAGERLVVLLTRDFSSYLAQTNVVVVRVAGKEAVEVSRTVLNGWLADSRLLGNRLYVATSDWGAQTAGTTLSEVLVATDGSQTIAAAHQISGQASGALISAGSDWMAVTTNDWQDWNHSQVTLFKLDETGATVLTPNSIKTAGSVYDKFKVAFHQNTLMVVSAKYDMSNGWTPVSVLENFSVAGDTLATLEIKRGEQLRATRFAGDKLYVVTAQQTDPLWLIDLTDPTAPSVTGSVEVPGFSTYIEPVGDSGQFLFTIGYDSGKVAVSLFDVSDASKPALKSRVFIEESGWGYSEATYDEKALKILTDDGLALIPFSAFSRSPIVFASTTAAISAATTSTSEKTSFVRLVDIDLQNGGSLTLRGRLDHEFTPRRATLINGILTSISQKELITAKIDDRDHPAVLADVMIAWPVNQVIPSGEYLLQISDGSSALWSGDKAAVRISKGASENTIVNDIELGDGIVQDAVLRSSRLYVLRKNWNPNLSCMPFVCFVNGGASSPTTAELGLDIYDASALPALPLLGRVSINTGSAATNCTISSLLWVTDSLPVVMTQNNPAAYWRYPMVAFNNAVAPPLTSSVGVMVSSVSPKAAALPTASLAMPFMPAYNIKPAPAMVRPIDVSNPSAPVALRPYPLATTLNTLVTTCAAGDGLLVFGYGQSPAPWRNAKWPAGTETPQVYSHRLGVLDFATPQRPIQRIPVVLPGRLFALGEVSRSGFLAFTENVVDRTDGPVRQLQVSLVDETQASLCATTEVGVSAILAAEGRTVMVADGQSVQRLMLDDTAQLVQTGGIAKLNWVPYELKIQGLTLLTSNGNEVLRVSWPGLDAVVESWKVQQWFPVSRLMIGSNRALYAPVGDYGVNVLQPR